MTESAGQAGAHFPPGAFANGIPFVFPGVPGVRCAFTTARAGNLALHDGLDAAAKERTVAARSALPGTFGFQAWAEARQVHGTGIVTDPEPAAADRAPSTEADGLFSARGGLALASKTADCQPILLTCRDGRAVAALHAGWRGNVRNFPGIGVRAFCETYALHPSEVLAVRGPSLGPAAAEFVNFEREWPDEFRPWFDEARRVMDLWSLARHQLAEAGVPPEQIFGLDLCTQSLPELFFSYRRKDASRQMSFIWKE